MSMDNISEVFTGLMPEFVESLAALPHAHHNLSHGQRTESSVAEILSHLSPHVEVTKREAILLGKCGLLHDYGHCGHPYRQMLLGGSESNEEHTVRLLRKALEGKLREVDIRFIERHVLATATGQSDYGSLPAQWKHLHRKYAPQSVTELVLALADVYDFSPGGTIFLRRP
jgi:hypothetical protein